MTVTKKEAQATLDASDHLSPAQRKVFQALIDAMPPDPESRAERLGRVCEEAYVDAWPRNRAGAWIAAAAAVEAECKPREVTMEWYVRHGVGLTHEVVDRINAYVRGEDV